MASFDFSIADIIDNSDEVISAVEEKIHLALALMGEEVEKNAKGNCPVDTGLLRNSITYAHAGSFPAIVGYTDDSGQQFGDYKTATEAATDNVETVYVGTNVEYAPYVEFRSAHHDTGKSHFLRDAGTQHIARLKSIAQTTLKEI